MGQCSTSIKAYDFKKISSEISNIKRRVCYLESSGGSLPVFSPNSVIFADSSGNLTDDIISFTYNSTTKQLNVNAITIGRGGASDSQSVVIGNNAGANLTTGAINNTFYGYNTGNGFVTGDYNVVIGWNSADSNNGNGNYAGNVVVGPQAMRTVRGSNVVAIGNAAANAGGTNSSVFIGSLAGYLATTGNFAAIDGNVGIGYAALYKVSEVSGGGYNNTAVGYNSGFSITTGKMNTLVGVGTGGVGTCTGDANTGVGLGALLTLNNNAQNVAFGYYALSSLQAGANANVAIGYSAGSSITTGSYNVVIGGNNGASIATSSNNILISDGAGNIKLTIDSAHIFTLTNGLQDFADDAAAAVGGIPVNGLYRTASVVKIRVA